MRDAVSRLLNTLEAALQVMPAHRYWVAYSGGIDSHVLLHAVASLRPHLPGTLNAVHVNHGLNPAAGEWSDHCVAVCDALKIPCQIFNVDADPQKGESLEAAARDARYAAFAELIEPSDLLLTAHHQEDQAETLLLQLLRGAGPQGLAAMPRSVPFFAGAHARPLLNVSKGEIEAYAAERSLLWIDDPSNEETGFKRNYLRHEVVPKLKTQWPSYAKTVSRSAAHCAEAALLLELYAAEEMAQICGWQPGAPLPSAIPLLPLQRSSPERRRNILRFWLKGLKLPLVSSVIMTQIEDSVVDAREDATPLVSWAGGELRRYRDRLYAMRPLSKLDPATTLSWDLQQPLELPAGLGRLMAKSAECSTLKVGEGLSRARCADETVTVRFRQGGERCRLPGRDHSHTLKGLLQQAGVPPWLRDRTPLIYVGGQLAAVVGHCYCAPFQAEAGEAAVMFALQ